MITIQADNVAELRKIFSDMFGTATIPCEAPAVPQKPDSKSPVKKAGQPAPAPEPKVEEAAAPGTVKVDVPDETGRTATYEEVIALVKKLKASTVPDILDKVNAWKTSGGYPALKESTPEQLGNALTFIESLEG